ncbi:MAG: glycosyltransferase, partial [Candidatus Micrarchaeaceae archaeon]
EGFGLPLVEAIQKRIPVIASDIDVFREIGKDYPVYFNPNDPNDLIEKIKLLGKQLNNKEKTSNSYPLNWDDSIKLMCERIKNYV